MKLCSFVDIKPVGMYGKILYRYIHLLFEPRNATIFIASKENVLPKD